jgi:hypothetical protein
MNLQLVWNEPGSLQSKGEQDQVDLLKTMALFAE